MHGITATLMVIARSSIPVHQCVLATKTPIPQVGSAGWRLDLRHSIIHSWAQINYRRQFGDDTYVANGGLKSTALTFSRDGKAQDKNWVDIAIGADFPLSATVSAFAGLAQTAGLSDGNQTRYNVGFSARF